MLIRWKKWAERKLLSVPVVWYWVATLSKRDIDMKRRKWNSFLTRCCKLNFFWSIRTTVSMQNFESREWWRLDFFRCWKDGSSDFRTRSMLLPVKTIQKNCEWKCWAIFLLISFTFLGFVSCCLAIVFSLFHQQCSYTIPINWVLNRDFLNFHYCNCNCTSTRTYFSSQIRNFTADQRVYKFRGSGNIEGITHP